MKTSTGKFDQIYLDQHCLSEVQMVAYVREQLSDEEAHQVEKHLINCPFCSDAVEGLQAFGDTDRFQEIHSDLQNEIEERSQVRRLQPEAPATGEGQQDEAPVPFFARYGKFFAAAAVVALLAVFGVGLLNSNPSTEDILNQYYSEAILPVHTTAGDEDGKPIFSMRNAFNEGQHEEVVKIFENGFGPNDPERIAAQLFAGQSELALGNAEAAVKLLKGASETEIPEYREMAQWLLGRAYLENGDKAEAKKLYEAITKSNSGYAREASEILEMLED